MVNKLLQLSRQQQLQCTFISFTMEKQCRRIHTAKSFNTYLRQIIAFLKSIKKEKRLSPCGSTIPTDGTRHKIGSKPCRTGQGRRTEITYTGDKTYQSPGSNLPVAQKENDAGYGITYRLPDNNHLISERTGRRTECTAAILSETQCGEIL